MAGTKENPCWVQASYVEETWPESDLVNVIVGKELFLNCKVRESEQFGDKKRRDIHIHEPEELRVWFNEADIVPYEKQGGIKEVFAKLSQDPYAYIT